MATLDERPSVHLFGGLAGDTDGQNVVVHHQVDVTLADAWYVRPDVELLCERWGYIRGQSHSTQLNLIGVSV